MRRSLVLSIILHGCVSTPDDPSPPLEDQILETNKQISDKIDEVAERLDVYMANDRFVVEPNRSRVVVRNAFYLTEGGKREYRPQLAAKLHLPNLQEKLQLSFTNYDEDDTDRGINERRIAVADEEQHYGTSLALFQELGQVKTEFRPRLEYTDTLLTSYLFKFTSKAERGTFSIEPELQLFARSDTGTGQFFALNFGLKLTDADDLTFVNEEQYTDGDNTMRTNHGTVWNHHLSERTMVRESVIVESDNRSTYHLVRTVVSSSLRHKIWKNVLHYALTPYLTFPKEGAFHPVASVDLLLEVIF